MMAKLKDLGNTVLGMHLQKDRRFTLNDFLRLGKFGLSTDNFKFEPNGQGGYGMNFVR